MKTPAGNASRAFTLIEMTLALALTMGIASAVIGLLQQQVSFTRILSNFRFLRDEAPQINTLLTTLINKADSYRVYSNRSNAMAGSGAVMSGGRALRLRLRNPDGTSALAVIAFELHNGQNRLNFYYRNHNSSSWPTSPSWTITSSPTLVDFSNNTGILLITMTGPKGEEVTYAGNPN